jgi:HlyD family secretion protein
LQSLQERGLASVDARDAALTRAQSLDFSCQGARNEQENAQAALDLQRALLDETQLRAPFPGVVAEITGEVGEFVTPSPPGVATPPAVDLIDDSCLYVTVPIDEVDAGRLSVGQRAAISLDAFRGKTFRGRVSRIAPYVLEIEKQARTVAVDVHLEDPGDLPGLLVGYSADVDIVLEVSTDVLRVPSEAVLEGDQLFRLNDDGRLQRLEITPGLRNWNFIEVRDGVSAGDRIVVSLDVPGLDDGALATDADDSTGRD